MPLPSSPACQVCGPHTDISPDSLFKCSRCQVVLYCGREHQRSHFATHKTVCKEIKKNRDFIQKEDHKIRSALDDSVALSLPESDYALRVGSYVGAFDNRSYSHAKIMLIQALSTIPSRPAIENALAEAMDLLDFRRDDNDTDIHCIVPTFHLLLGQYQEAYDFIKWWATTARGNINFDNKELPYININGANMTEEPSPDLNSELFFASSIVYIKMMLAKGIQEAINAHELADRESLPAAVADSLGDFLVPQGLPTNREELKQLQTKLTSQLHEAFRQTHSQNEHFWDAMLNPTPIIQLPMPVRYADGDMNQVRMWIEQNAMLWQNHKQDIREIRVQSLCVDNITIAAKTD